MAPQNNSLNKRLYIFAQGFLDSDQITYSIPVRMDTTEDQAHKMREAIYPLTTGIIVALGWRNNKPFWKETDTMMLRKPGSVAMSLLRWYVTYDQSYSHIYSLDSNRLYPRSGTNYSEYVNIPFANPHIPPKADVWGAFDELFPQIAQSVPAYWKAPYYSNLETSIKLKSHKLKYSYVGVFVRNVIGKTIHV